MAKAQHLRTQRCFGDLQIFRSPGGPFLPVIAAAPAEHDENSLLVGEVEEVFGLELAFEADGVEVHVAHHAELIAQPVAIGAEQHVLRPSGAADEDRLAVHAEEAAARGCELGSNFADSELNCLFVRDLALRVGFNGKRFKMRLAHLPGPPELWMRNAQRRKFARA